jgi:hypothetical protein
MCEAVILYIKETCTPVLAIATHELSGTKYDFLAHSIWQHIVTAIEKNMSVIFMPGIPTVFHNVSFKQVTLIAH